MFDEDAEIKRALKVAKIKMPDFDTAVDLFDMSFVYISEKSARLSGYKPKEMLGKHISNFMTASPKSKEFTEAILSSLSGRAAIPIKTKSGKEVVVPMDFLTIEVDSHPFLVTRAVKYKPIKKT